MTAQPAVGGLGLVWELVNGDSAEGRKADLDLFVSVRGIVGECWWNHKELANVVCLHNDVRDARGLGATGDDRQVFEFVEFSRRDLRPEDLTVWVKIYEHAGAQKIRALFRLQTADGTNFNHVFEMPAVRGNKGGGDRATAKQWHRIDVSKVMAEGAARAGVSTGRTAAH